MGGYIPIWKDLLTDPKFRRVVKAYVSSTDYGHLAGISHVIGALAVLWIYADTHADESDVLTLSVDEVDELVGIPGFAALLPPQWLQVLDSDHVKLPNFQAHNGSAARKKIQNAEAQARWRQRNSNGASLRKQDEHITDGSPPIPSHPIPSLPSEGGVGGNARAEHSLTPSGKARKGTRVPEPFEVTVEMHAWAAEKCPHVSVSMATEEFVDYWRAVPGAKGRKLDWPGTWRNRMRELEGRATRIPAGTKPVVTKGGWQ